MNIGRRWRALRHERLQTILAVAAMATAVALPVVLLSVGGGVASHEISVLQSSGYQITVSAAGIHGVGLAHALAGEIAALPSVASASPILTSAVDAFPLNGGPTPVLAEGVIPQAFASTENPTERGLFPNPLPFSDPTDSVHFANGSYRGPSAHQVMVSSPFAQEFDLTIGSPLTLAESSNISSGVPFTVVGIFGIPPTSFGVAAAYAIVMGLSDLQVMEGLAFEPSPPYAIADPADTVLVSLVPSVATDSATIDHVAAEISALVPYYGVSELTDEAAQLKSSTTVLTGFYLALSSVALLVGLLFLVLVLLRRVESQRRTVAVRRALGVPGSQIALGWVRSGVLLAFGGVAGGILAGVVLVGLLDRFGQGAVATAASLAVFDPVTLAYLSLGVLGLGALAGLGAARSALRRPIVEALR
jgi:putative ABC transport system permease protein